MSQPRCPFQTSHQDLQPVDPRHKDGSLCGWIEIARFDPFQACCFGGAHCTQAFRLQTLRLFQHAFVPDHIGCFFLLKQSLYLFIGSFPQVFQDQATFPLLRMQQVRYSLYPGWSPFASQQVISQLTQQQPTIPVTVHQDHQH